MVFNSVVGLDIGSSHVRAVECVKDKKSKTFKIVKAGEINLPHNIVLGGEVQQVEELAEAIRMLWRDEKFNKTRIVVGVTGEHTLIREIELPWEKPDLFRSSLPLRLNQDLPVNPYEVELDYYPTGEFVKRNVLLQRALLVGALKKAVLKTEIAARMSKLVIRRVDYSPYALLRAAQMEARLENPQLYSKKNSKKVEEVSSPLNSLKFWEKDNTNFVIEKGDDGKETYFLKNQYEEIIKENSADSGMRESYGQVVVNMGSQVTEVVIHSGDKPLFMRTTLVGSQAVTNALAEKLNIKEGEAEHLKTTLGLEESQNPETLKELLAKERIPWKAVEPAQKIINIMAQALVQNVREIVEYYLDMTHEIDGINRVRVSGGGILLPGYVERLAGELQTETTILDALTRFGDSKVQKLTDSFYGSDYATSYGLAVKP